MTRMAPKPLDDFVLCTKSWVAAPDPETTDQFDCTWCGPFVATIGPRGSQGGGRNGPAALEERPKYPRGPSRPSQNQDQFSGSMETRCQCPSTFPEIRQCCGLSACRAQVHNKLENMEWCEEGHVPDPVPRQKAVSARPLSPNTGRPVGGEAPIPAFTCKRLRGSQVTVVLSGARKAGDSSSDHSEGPESTKIPSICSSSRLVPPCLNMGWQTEPPHQ